MFTLSIAPKFIQLLFNFHQTLLPLLKSYLLSRDLRIIAQEGIDPLSVIGLGEQGEDKVLLELVRKWLIKCMFNC